MKKQLLLLMMILLPMAASADYSGTCGDNLTWTLVESTGTLTIEGSGSMKDYEYSGFSNHVFMVLLIESCRRVHLLWCPPRDASLSKCGSFGWPIPMAETHVAVHVLELVV